MEVPETRHARNGGSTCPERRRTSYVGSGIEFEDRGTHEVKSVPGEWRLYSVRG